MNNPHGHLYVNGKGAEEWDPMPYEPKSAREKFNYVVFDRWRGVVLVVVSVLVALAASLGYRSISPDERVTSLEQRMDASEIQAKTIDRKLDLLIRLRCRELTPADVALLDSDFGCRGSR